ncbi:unnamed protein product [Tuber aestivum]|uniref:Uncharacterized protein n=1 Tax=Tuber aestivum TaxID=59557 RepID=A0A292Q6B5_9PEZI|nr:unnamed protein product [Tuber aestivum]
MSDPTQGVRSGLQGRVNNNLDILLKRFESIIELASVYDKDRIVKDRTATAVEAYQIECHASSMASPHFLCYFLPLGLTNSSQIRAAEDLLALTRSLKEAWLFGQLGSELGVVDEATDQIAREVGEALQKLATKKVGGLDQ